MKSFIRVGVLFVLIFHAAGCGKKQGDQQASAEQIKSEIEKLKSERSAIDAEIAQKEVLLNKLSPGASAGRVRLVSVAPVTTTYFRHYIDLRGQIDAENISYISPRMGAGQVKEVYVKKGQPVKKGQLLLKLDDAILRQQVIAARQQLEGIKTQLNFARTIYDRQKNLWDKGIGTEVQLINAKTNAESLENQLKSSSEQVKVAEEQLRTSNVYSDVDGVADVVNIRVGEIFTGTSPAGPQIKIVNMNNPKVVINVPENYIGRLRKGSKVELYIPDADKRFESEISVLSQSIDPVQRGFIAEARVPRDASLKPNQTVIVRIMDYAAENAVVIPVNVVQSDENGKFVFMALSSGGSMKATRATVVPGEVSGDSIEIKKGISAGQMLVTEGYQNLYQGQLITVKP